MRKISFANGEYYHIYNRGVDKRDVFCNSEDYTKFLVSMKIFNNLSSYEQRAVIKNNASNKELSSRNLELSSLLESKLVEIVCYCLNPNHYHLLLKQTGDDGIRMFMHKIGTSFTNYFNQKNDRSGSLFQGPFKAILIDTNEYLLWLSAYINGNASIHRLSDARNYKWCSYPDYLGSRAGVLCSREAIMSNFADEKEYENYVDMVISESGSRKDLEKYFIESA